MGPLLRGVGFQLSVEADALAGSAEQRQECVGDGEEKQQTIPAVRATDVCRLQPKAEVNVLFYVKHKVVANFAFAEGKMTEEDVQSIIKMVDDTLAKKK